MLEIPEAIVIAAELNQTIKDKRIEKVIAAASPHKFAWFFGDPSQYYSFLRGRKIENTVPYGGRMEINAGEYVWRKHQVDNGLVFLQTVS